MPSQDTHTGGPIDGTSRGEKDEVCDDIIDSLGSVDDIRRDRNSIKTSSNFHLDARHVDEGYKVEIQRKRGNKKTVSCVIVEDSCQSLQDLVDALEGSLRSQTVWHAT